MPTATSSPAFFPPLARPPSRHRPLPLRLPINAVGLRAMRCQDCRSLNSSFHSPPTLLLPPTDSRPPSDASLVGHRSNPPPSLMLLESLPMSSRTTHLSVPPIIFCTGRCPSFPSSVAPSMPLEPTVARRPPCSNDHPSLHAATYHHLPIHSHSPLHAKPCHPHPPSLAVAPELPIAMVIAIHHLYPWLRPVISSTHGRPTFIAFFLRAPILCHGRPLFVSSLSSLLFSPSPSLLLSPKLNPMAERRSGLNPVVIGLGAPWESLQPTIGIS